MTGYSARGRDEPSMTFVDNIMSIKNRRKRAPRRGVIVVLAALLAVFMLGMIAFALDVGVINMSRTQLQTAADSAAMAAVTSANQSQAQMVSTAQQFAAYNDICGTKVSVLPQDVQWGMWDTTARTFTASAASGNAVKVTTRATAATSGQVPLFFGAVWGLTGMDVQASAIAMANPRDIAFVMDVSGSMNDDTNPANTDTLNSTYAAQGYPTIGTDLVQAVYTDFGYGAYPGTTQAIGQPLGVTTLSALSSTSGPLKSSSIPLQYRIKSGDSSTVRKQKAYSWTMDVQMAAIMPNAKPPLNSTAYYAYWAKFLDSYQSTIGYKSYLRFMMDQGRNGKPDGSNYTPLSQYSPYCSWHTESTPGGAFSFPPREQPMHASRRSLIAAIQVVKERNQSIADTNQRDWVSIIWFDSTSTLLLPLTSDYDAAMLAATKLQAGSSTCTESPLVIALAHLKPQAQGGQGRLQTNKIVVLLTDGMPNGYTSSSSTINSYISAHPDSNFYNDSSKRAHDAALMQTMNMQLGKWFLYPVGVGLGCDYDFMDRMARMGVTADKDGQAPRGSGSPIDYETKMTTVFQKIITNPKVRLVK